MRRALLAVCLSVAAIGGCDSPSPSAGPSTTASATAAASGLPSGLAPLSSSAMQDQPVSPASASATAEPEFVAVQHVLVAYRGASRAPKAITRSKADAKKRAEEAAEKAKSSTDFSELVKAYSDEPGAADRLGSTGKFKRGAMAPPFEKAAFALKVGEVSGVVESEFGFHVIKRNQ